MGYLILFGWSFLAATVLPLGSEAMVVGLLRGDATPWVVVTVATVGNFLGACTLWWMGKRAAHLAAERWGSSAMGSRATRLLQRWGKPALALSWAPFLGDLIVALAGASGISLASFTPWVLVSKAARYAIVAWIVLQM